jgi:hypothetical protein
MQALHKKLLTRFNDGDDELYGEDSFIKEDTKLTEASMGHGSVKPTKEAAAIK